MIVYPKIELLSGRCVSAQGGMIEAAETWHVDPVAVARGWRAAGAEWMHLTDLDWAMGRPGHAEQVREIIRGVGIPVQLAGGFRRAEDVHHWIDLGAGRIVISTLAVQDPSAVRALAAAHPDQIVLSLDVMNGDVMTHGWLRRSAIAPEDFIAAFADAPLAGIVITDIEADSVEAEAQLGMIAGLASTTRHPVIASGVVRSLDDISRLKYIPNIAGAIIGRPLFRKRFDLASALRLARPEAEPVAQFL